MRGESVTGYRSEKGVPGDSRTETYVAMKFFINNWRWGGVPFYIRTGKRTADKCHGDCYPFQADTSSSFPERSRCTYLQSADNAHTA